MVLRLTRSSAKIQLLPRLQVRRSNGVEVSLPAGDIKEISHDILSTVFIEAGDGLMVVDWLLRSPEPTRCQAGVDELKKLGGPDVRAILSDMLFVDQDKFVRQSALHALAELYMCQVRIGNDSARHTS